MCSISRCWATATAVSTTAADLSAFWDALFAGRIVTPERVAEMVRPHSDWPEESRRYGLGFHVHAKGGGVWLEGHDAGVSFTSAHETSSSITYTVISNWSEGAWPIIKRLRTGSGPETRPRARLRTGPDPTLPTRAVSCRGPGRFERLAACHVAAGHELTASVREK